MDQSNKNWYRLPITIKPKPTYKKLKLRLRRGESLSFGSLEKFYFSLGDGGRLAFWFAIVGQILIVIFAVNAIFTTPMS
jgi:hypothetical protein